MTMITPSMTMETCGTDGINKTMETQMKKHYLGRSGMACAVCFGPHLNLKIRDATADMRDNLTCLLIPVVCHTCGWEGQEVYKLSDVDHLTKEDMDEGCFRSVKDS